jgi:phosphohistidine phosphatase SixA
MRARTALSVAVIVALAGAISPSVAVGQSPGPAPLLRGRELVDALRGGGYVVYFRHAATDSSQADTDRENLERCDTQRNLSAEGRRMARDIGQAFRALGIRVGKVISSPYCRAVDTAELAFGRPEKSASLYFSIGADREERARLSAELRRILATAPVAGTNTVLVSHHANLKEATGLWPKREGDAHVFRPRPGGAFEHVGEAGPDDWPRWARDAGDGDRPAGPRRAESGAR